MEAAVARKTTAVGAPSVTDDSRNYASLSRTNKSPDKRERLLTGADAMDMAGLHAAQALDDPALS